jgi:hypothetical protein
MARDRNVYDSKRTLLFLNTISCAQSSSFALRGQAPVVKI